jgi:sugar transferase (PEP-CTERM/EpsH1 system associated)
MLGLARRLCLALLTLLLLPVLAVVAAALLFFNLVFRVTRPVRRPPPDPEAPRERVASIVILNWNGRDLLEQGLPSVIEAVRSDGRGHEIIVVDNGSEDGSVEYVRRAFPGVRVLALPQNLGFVEGNNAGVLAAGQDIVILLNNDMVVDRGFIAPLVEGFGERTFAVASQVFLQDPAARREETGKTTAAFRLGRIDYGHVEPPAANPARRYYPTLWAGGGSSAFDRRKFLQLGGFDALYSPMYVEDTDLSYRAWRIGWEVLFAPESIVYHKHRASSNRRFGASRLTALIARNQLLFLWKNIRDWSLLASHVFFLPWNCYRLARDHGIAVWRGFFGAAARLAQVEVSKFSQEVRGARSDREVFDLFAQPGTFFAPTRIARGASDPPRVLWVTAYLPHVGRHAGAGRMYQMLSRLAGSYRITLLSFLESEEERDYVAPLEMRCERVLVLRRIPPHRVQLFAYEPFEEFRTPEMEARVARELEERDFDLIQLEYSQMACYADRRLGIPTLLTKHEVDFAACLRQARMETSAGRKLKWFYRYLQVLDREVALTLRADAAICMTEPDARDLRKFCARVPVHVVHTGVDLDYFTPAAQPAARPRLVFVGAFQHYPNVDAMEWFCRAILPLIRAALPEVELYIVGSNPTAAVLELAEIPGVVVTGSVPDVRPYMAESSVYVVPLRLGVGIRGKVLEAWAMALPVVATTVAASGLHCEAGCDLLIADDADQFAAHVVSLLRDPERRARLGRAGRAAAERRYGWDASVRELDDLYRSYLARRNARTAPAAMSAG